jgi:branched-chain amino acid transport system permease protein
MIFNPRISNFARRFVMLGGMMSVFFRSWLGLDSFPPSCWPWPPRRRGPAMERLTIRPIQGASPINLVIATIGVSILMRGAAMLVWGKDTYSLPPFGGSAPIAFAGAAIQPQSLWALAITLALLAALKLFFSTSIHGKAMLACACDRKAASLMGISVARMSLFSFALSALTGAVGGAILAPITMTSYDVGMMLGLKGFAACILGGLGNPFGAAVGGLCIGVMESFGAGYVSSAYKDAFAFVILLLLLFVRPSGFSARPGCSGYEAPASAKPAKAAIFAAILFAAPLFLPNEYYINILILGAINALIALGLNLLLGYAGQISLGHAAFFGLSAYATAYATARLGLPIPAGMALGVALSGAVAWLIGIPTLRLRGHYLAMATLGFGIIVHIVMNETVGITGGPSGFVGIARLNLFGVSFDSDRSYYYLTAAVLALAALFCLNLIDSRLGRALRAIHTSERAAQTAGVDIAGYKLFVFVLSAVFAGVAGCSTPISCASWPRPPSGSPSRCSCGHGRFRRHGQRLGGGGRGLFPHGPARALRGFEEVDILVYGAILVLCVMYLPQGLAGAASGLRRRLVRSGGGGHA